MSFLQDRLSPNGTLSSILELYTDNTPKTPFLHAAPILFLPLQVLPSLFPLSPDSWP